MRGNYKLPNLIQRLARSFPLDFSGKVSDTVLIAGVGRSGTTWLADFINFDNRYRDLFEPFHAWMIPEAEVLKGYWYQRPGDTPPLEFTTYVERVLRGRVRHLWIDRFNKRPVSGRRLVKAIRANLFLGWLAAHYPELKIILLIRHPAAVAQSRIRLHEGWEWRPTLDEMLAQSTLRKDLSEEQRQLLSGCESPFRQHIGSWCLAYWASLSHLPDGRILQILYEDLHRNPQTEMQRVFQYLDREWDDTCLALHQVPSRTTRNRQIQPANTGDPTTSCFGEVSMADRVWMESAMMEFGLNRLYDQAV